MGDESVRDYVFPLIRMEHPVGVGTFLPGSFTVNFFLPSLAIMCGLNLIPQHRFGPLLAARANVFYYILVLIVAILEVGADTVLPILALHGSHGFASAVSIVHAGFFTALGLATVVSRGANRDW